VVAFNTAEGWSRDVSEDIAGEVLERAFDADDNLSTRARGRAADPPPARPRQAARPARGSPATAGLRKNIVIPPLPSLSLVSARARGRAADPPADPTRAPRPAAPAKLPAQLARISHTTLA
jgi:hypothetical protein